MKVNNFFTTNHLFEPNASEENDLSLGESLKNILASYRPQDLKNDRRLDASVGTYIMMLLTMMSYDELHRTFPQSEDLINLQDIIFDTHHAVDLVEGKLVYCKFSHLSMRLSPRRSGFSMVATHSCYNLIWEILFYENEQFARNKVIQFLKNVFYLLPVKNSSLGLRNAYKRSVGDSLSTLLINIRKHLIVIKHADPKAEIKDILNELIRSYNGGSDFISEVLKYALTSLDRTSYEKQIEDFNKRLEKEGICTGSDLIATRCDIIQRDIETLEIGCLITSPDPERDHNNNLTHRSRNTEAPSLTLDQIIHGEPSLGDDTVIDLFKLPYEIRKLMANSSRQIDESVAVLPGFSMETAHRVKPQMDPESMPNGLMPVPKELSSDESFLASLLNNSTDSEMWSAKPVDSNSEESSATQAVFDRMEIDLSQSPTPEVSEAIDLTEESVDLTYDPKQATVLPITEKTKEAVTKFMKKYRCRLNNEVLSEWQKYSNEISQALIKSNNLSGFYLDDFSPQVRNNLLKPLVDFYNDSFQKTSKRVLNEFFFHFGIKATENLKLPSELKGLIPIEEKYSESLVNKLSTNFAIHTAPALYKFKQDQYSRLVSSDEEIEASHAPQNIPCIIPVPSSARIKLIPLSMIIQKNKETIDLTTHISGITHDEESCCVAYLKEKNVSFELDEEGLIALECQELEKLHKILEAESEVVLYALQYRGAVQGLSEENNKDLTSPVEFETLMIEEERQKTPPENVKSNFEKPLLKKRNREEFEEDIYDAQLIDDAPPTKKQKVDGSNSTNGKFVTSRKGNEAKEFDINSVPLELGVSENHTSDKQGTLINITGESVANEQLNNLGLNATLSEILSHTIKSAVEKIANKSAFNRAKNWEQLDFPNIEKIKNYIVLSQNEKIFKSASFPLIETLKDYQIDTLRKIRLQIECGVTPLCSLWMGLGKTPVYANLCAELIAEGKDGVIPILVPAATRGKTKSEMRKWISEAKITALKVLYQHSPEKFKETWDSKFKEAKLRYANSYRESNRKLQKSKSFLQKQEELVADLYWDTMYPLLSTAYLCKEKLMVNNLIEETVSLFLNDLTIDQQMKEQLSKIEHIGFDDGKPILITPSYMIGGDTKEKVIDSILQISQLSNYPRNALPEDAKMRLSQDGCLNLINYDISKIVSLNGSRDYEKIKTVYGTSNAIIIAGYEQLKNSLEGNEELKKFVYERPHLAVFADEASKYHTDSNPKKKSTSNIGENVSSLSKFIVGYSEIVQKHGGFFLGVTATPFENNIKELIKLLTISNKKGDFKKTTIKSILEMQKKAIETICDSITESEVLESEDLLKSFAHANVLAQIIEQCVVSKTFTDRDVIEAWGDKIPKEKRVLSRVRISQENKELASKIITTCAQVYKSTSSSVKDRTIINLTPCIARCLIDGDDGKLQLKDNAALTSSINSIGDKILNYKKNNDLSVLNKHFLAKTLITNEQFKNMMTQNSRAIIVYEFDAEAKVLQIVLEKYYNKPVIEFGENDKKRSAALNELTNSDNAVLLLPAKAGGVGLNLGYVDNLVFLRNSWNPATQRQFIARVLRVGRGSDRNILELFFENIHSYYVRTKFTEKTLASEFFMSSKGTVQERFEKWCKILSLRALQNLMLRSTKKPGFYNSTPILELLEENGQRSIERLLVGKIKEIQEAVNYDEFTERFENMNPLSAIHIEEVDPSPMEIDSEDNPELSSIEAPVVKTTSKLANALQTLPPSKYQRIPLNNNWSVEEVKRFAAAIADPNNQNMVNQYFGKFITRLRKEKNKYADQIRANGFNGATQFMNEKFSVLSSNVSDIYRYSQSQNSYVLEQTEGNTGNSRGLIYKSQNGPNSFRYDVLMPIDVANEAEKRYLSSLQQQR
ncbi:MAG: helicase-related protein [Chlamydiota bacterium]|nr:helicase-related protein [Chlamydiota bacterium]